MPSDRKLAPIAVPAAQRKKLHSLVAGLKAAARAAQEDKGVLALDYSKVLRVRTSSRCLDRALALMDVLIREFESRGYNVTVGERAETRLILKEGAISFRLDERTKRIAPPPAPPRFSGGRHPSFFPSWRPAFALVATGEFTLTFERYRLRGCRNSWRDRPASSLEEQLGEVMGAIPSWEAALEAQRAEKESRELQAREAAARRLELAREKEVLRRQREKLVGDLIAWECADRLRQFIAAVQEAVSHDEETQAWLNWADHQVRALDPLCSRLSSVTSLEARLEKHFTGHPVWEEPKKGWWNQ